MQRFLPYIFMLVLFFGGLWRIQVLEDANVELERSVASSEIAIKHMRDSMETVRLSQQYGEIALKDLIISSERKTESLSTAFVVMEKTTDKIKSEAKAKPNSNIDSEISTVRLQQVWSRYCDVRPENAGCK